MRRAVLAFLPLLAAAAAAQHSGPVVPGLLSDPPLDARDAAAVLAGELRCGACHAALPAAPPAPVLDGVGARLAPDFLRRFLQDPAAAHPGARMPALVTAREAEALTHFLVARDGASFARGSAGADERARGRALFHRVGCVACHPGSAEGEQGSGGVTLDHVAAKYGLEGLAAFLFDPLAVRPAGRMPDLALSREEARAIAAWLLGDPQDVPRADDALDVRAELAREGERLFAELRCAACHAPDQGAARTDVPLARAEGGCLAPHPVGPAPRYALDPGQRALLGLACAQPPTPERELERTLVALGCLQCHARDGHGGVAPEVDRWFTTDEPELGDAARLPPPLTGVGAKLQPGWLRKVLFDGARARTVMHARMPRFGEANVARLPELLERADAGTLAAFDLPAPADDEEANAWHEAGRTLLGIRGMSCVSCHDWNGKPSPNRRGIDLITSGERLRPEWFARFLLSPQALRPGIVMPESWPGGVTSVASVLDGDTARQLGALWWTLGLGRSARDPEGVVARPTRLAVTDAPRTYRGRSRIAGFRGIAVGFPAEGGGAGWNYAFDAQNGALAGLWRGDFVSVSWDGQGAGDFRPDARAVELARDVALLAGAGDEAPWPLRPRTDDDHPVNEDPLYPRRLGYRFRGVTLDAAQVPTLRYSIGDVAIEDRAEPAREALRRTLLLRAPGATTLTLRVLAGDARALDARRFAAPGVTVTLSDEGARLRPSADGAELLWTLDLPAGDTTLTITYELDA